MRQWANAGNDTPRRRRSVWADAISPEMPIADPHGPQPRPSWFGNPNGQPAARRSGGPPDTTLYSLPGSKRHFTMAPIRSTSNSVDWFPEEHPPVPEIVTHVHPPLARPCYACHTLNGKGKPGNAPIAGLPKDYLNRQLHAFSSGRAIRRIRTSRRTCSDSRRA